MVAWTRHHVVGRCVLTLGLLHVASLPRYAPVGVFAGEIYAQHNDEPWALRDSPYVKILHPADGQTISSEWQGMLIASVGTFKVPADGSIAVYIDDTLAARMVEWPHTLMLPQLADGRHSIALSLQDTDQEVIAEDVVDLLYASSSTGPPLWDHSTLEGEGTERQDQNKADTAGGGGGGGEGLT